MRDHPEYRSAKEGKRRAMKRNVTVGDLTAIAKIYERAKEWRQWFDVVVDHIIPLIKGGTHEASNLQIIYGFDNARKHDSLTYKPRVVFL
jgi:5-methylcytosine-specific restriction endonuclease McrA